MRIGIVTTWFERGAAYVSMQYKKLLELKGHEVFIYARGEDTNKIFGSSWDANTVTTQKKDFAPIPTYIDLKEFKKWLKKNKIESVLFNEQKWLEPVALCRELGIKTGLYIDYYTENTIQTYRIFDFLICNTKRHYSVFEWHKQAYYVPWGTNIDLFDIAHKRQASDKIRFFTSAGMNPYRKGVDLAISAFYELIELESKLADQIELIVHTQIALETFFKDHDIQQKIKKIKQEGLLKEVVKTVSAPGLYYEGDIYLYLSRLDGIGLTLAEALAASMPIIIPNDAPMNEFLPEIGSQTVKLNKIFCRYDAYYWPQNEIDIYDLIRKIKFMVENKNNIDSFRNSSRLYAMNQLNWNDRVNVVDEIFCETELLSINRGDVDNALNISNDKYKFYAKFKKLYQIYYFLTKLLK
ncbi:MAG: glycosyltransferase [Terrisporobacter sp.]